MEFVLWLVGVALVIIWLGVVFIGPPYVPTHQKQIEKLFNELRLGKKDRVVDLGAGDGRVLVSAARRGAKVNGVEINPFLVLIAKWRLRRFANASMSLGNIWNYQLPNDTTYVFVFFAHQFMPQLERYLEEQGKHVSLVSYGFSFKDRKASKVVGAFNIYEF